MSEANNTLLTQQIEFLKNIGLLMEFANDAGHGLTLDNAHLDAQCEYGHHKALYSDRLALAFNLYRRTPDGRWDYFNLIQDHAMLGDYWQTLDKRCEWKGKMYSMPWRKE